MNRRVVVAIIGALTLVGFALTALVVSSAFLRLSEQELTNRVVSCRILLALRQTIVPGGPCDDEDVREQIDLDSVVPIGSRDDHYRTQRLVCAIQPAPVPECADVPVKGS